MNTDYTQAISLLMSDNIDFRKIATKLAKTNPALFCTLARTPADSSWENAVYKNLLKGNRLEAIKIIRTDLAITTTVSAKVGLKEAVEICDNFSTYLYNNGHTGFRNKPVHTISCKKSDEILQQLYNAF